jgi:hypothetical protein
VERGKPIKDTDVQPDKFVEDEPYRSNEEKAK